nr:type IV pilus biogenesis/stability protein PilW [Wenzhouxiangella sp. XN79A]
MIALSAVLATLALSGCATSSRETSPQRTGSAVERVSPVRAADINTRLGVGYLERGQIQLALEKLELAVRQDEQHVPAHLALGIVYERIGREERALEHLQRAVRLAPEDGAAHNSLAALLCRVGRYDEAERHFGDALEDPFYPTPEVVLANAGSCARRAGRLENAEAYLRQALEIDPTNRVALFNLAGVALAQGEAFSARAFLQRLEGAGQMGPDALLLGVRIERMLGNREEAERYATRLRARYPESLQVEQLQADES